ncbi:hypothetical protein Nazgul20 [Burkholderia phage BcepNazgul]|uniref:Uncharacterized protein n=1 Tax=Burkholderia phage BcepNazgul TaxID=242861 RepID=Q2HPF5_9CAUD|nr:hypothetical protein Nazgul20 [Burkholderia phage BcepNazgul]ABD46772.1 hypothetical protein Nazgul20 [Burkholderia phage BcepNazgul]
MSKIEKASVTVSFKTDSGYESVFGAQNKPGIDALKDGLHEIVRVLTINGNVATVDAVVKAAKRRGERAVLTHATAQVEQQSAVDQRAGDKPPSDDLLKALNAGTRPGILNVYRHILREHPTATGTWCIRRAKEMWGHLPLIALNAENRPGIAEIYADLRRANPQWSMSGLLREVERQWKESQESEAEL